MTPKQRFNMKHVYICSCSLEGGIYHYTFNNGKLSFCEKTPLDRPMYAREYNGKLYVVLREVDKDTHFGGIMNFDIDESGKLVNPSSVKSTNGLCPCHFCVKDNVAYIVNYLSGNIVGTNGKIDTHNGSGVNLPRQNMPHTHFVNVSPDKKYLLCCDLGLDTISTYDFDLNLISKAKVPDGFGARHLAYSPNGDFVYCVNELSSSISVFKYNDGTLTFLNDYSGILESTKENTAAAIRFVDNCLYVSNRGEDTIVCFKAEGEKLKLISRNSVCGKDPRDFDFLDNFVLSTNQNTNNITVFKADSGNFVKTQEIADIECPLCVTIV